MEHSGRDGLELQVRHLSENTGRLMYAQNINDGTLDRSYDYDQAGRLVAAYSGAEARAHMNIGPSGVVDGPYAQRYNYDVWGNITSREGWGGDNANFIATYTNNKRNGLTYGPAGHLVFDGGHTLTYDATGQQATASFPGYLLEQFYDGDGLRVKKNDAGTVKLYLRSTVLGGQVVAEMSGTGSWQRGYVYLGSQLLAIQQSGVYWVHQDPLVKSKRITNSSGNVVSTLELDPWGGNTSRNNNDVFQTHRFTNYERDLNAADEAMFRRYNRWWSRFDQPDPYGGSYNLTNPQSFNRYAYVNNDPVNLVDPLGLDPEGGLLGIMAAWGIGPTWTVNVPFDGGFGGGLGSGSGGGGEMVEPLRPEKPPTDPTPGTEPTNPTSPNSNDALTAQIINRLTQCVIDLYGVTFTSIQASTPNAIGIFQGTGRDQYRRTGGDAPIIITTDSSSFSSEQLRNMNNDYASRHPDHPRAGPGSLVLGVAFGFGLAGIVPVSPYLNYLANNPPADFSSNHSYLRRQIHELGHSLSTITGRGRGERGNQLEDCVYGRPFRLR